jgi:hypothetical protein
MSQRLLDIYSPKTAGAGTGRAECRVRAAELAAFDRAQRDALVQRMSSFALVPGERIRLWETVYRLRLPSRPDHALIQMIAQRTGLTAEDILAEQHRRAGRSE